MHARLPSNQTDMAVIVGNQRAKRMKEKGKTLSADQMHLVVRGF